MEKAIKAFVDTLVNNIPFTGRVSNGVFIRGTQPRKTDDRQRIVFHSLRHTSGSHLAMSGASLQTIQELLGHRNIETTMRYSHLLPDIKRGAVQELAGALENFSSESAEVINFEE